MLKFTLNRDKLPPGGIEGVLHLVPSSSDCPSEERMNDFEVRTFEIQCALAKALTFVKAIDGIHDKKTGESFFLLSHELDHLQVRVREMEFAFHKNEQHELSVISTELPACNYVEAIKAFTAAIVPFLDILVYRSNTPIAIEKIQCFDKKNEILSLSYQSPYDNQIIQPVMVETRGELLPLFALFREAKTNRSSYYRLLCYFKILEGIYDHMRPALFKSARKQKIEIERRKEIVPEHYELRKFNAAIIGRPVGDVYAQELRQEYRNAVAHFLIEGQQPLNVSDYEHSSRFTNMVLLAELCARVVIDTQEFYYEQYHRKGGQRLL